MKGPRLLRRLEAAGIGLFSGIAVAGLVADANYVALGAAALFASAVFLFVRALTPSATRDDVYLMVALALTLRYAVAVTLHDGLLAAGRGGFITGDDANYADLSWRLVQLFRGESVAFDYSSESYLLGTFVYLETAIFSVVGPNVVVVELLNAAFGAVLVALVCDLCRRVSADEGAALLTGALVALFPSLVLWASLNLKDSLALFLIASTLWLLVFYQRKPAAWLILAIYLPLLLMETLRFYIFLGLALVIPVGVFLAIGGTMRYRVVASGLSVGLTTLLIVSQATGNDVSPASLARLETERAAMAVGARTRFTAPALQVQSGTTYVVPGMPAGSDPERTPHVVVVQPNTTIVVGSPVPGSDAVFVLPGDVIVVGGPAQTPAPPSERKVLPVSGSSGQVQLVDASDDALAIRTLRYLPLGLAFALFAPFPWSGTRAQELLPIPEMLVWYLLVIAAVVGLWRWRHSWQLLAPIALFVVGTLTIFALAEGNVGTLFRHRAMVIPFVIVLAAPALIQLLDRRSLRRVAPTSTTERSPSAA